MTTTGNKLWGLVAGILIILVILPHFLKYHHQDFMIFLVVNVLVVVSYRLVTLTGEWSLIHAVMMGGRRLCQCACDQTSRVFVLAWPADCRHHRRNDCCTVVFSFIPDDPVLLSDRFVCCRRGDSTLLDTFHQTLWWNRGNQRHSAA